jgi:hypothetical protein
MQHCMFTAPILLWRYHRSNNCDGVHSSLNTPGVLNELEKLLLLAEELLCCVDNLLA